MSYIPTNDAMFESYTKHLISYVSANMKNWQHIDEGRFKELEKSFNSFENAFEAAKQANTTANVREKQRTQKECEKVLRAFVNQYLRFPPVTDKDRDEMKIPNPTTTRTMHTEVKETVDFTIHIKGTNNIIVDFRQTGSASKAKPKGYDGAVIIWAINDTEPEKTSEYVGHTMASRTPYTIEFRNHDSGKRVWVKIAWQNARGILGRWSEAQTAIIP